MKLESFYPSVIVKNNAVQTYEYSVDALGDRLDNCKPINEEFIGLTTASTNQVLPCIIVQLGYGGDVMELIEAISLYMDYCSGRQLRNKTQESYENLVTEKV